MTINIINKFYNLNINYIGFRFLTKDSYISIF